MILRLLLMLLLFIAVLFVLISIVKRFIPTDKKDNSPLPASQAELQSLKKELEEKLAILVNKQEIAEMKAKIDGVNKKLEKYS